MQFSTSNAMGRDRPCDQCLHWGGPVYRIHGRCNRPGSSPIVAMPSMGCCYWRPADGSDPPPRASFLAPPVDDDMSDVLRETPPGRGINRRRCAA